ncbi:hypothetical protein ACVBEH_05295, partial [Roseateles sp. GG27B]
MSIEIFLPTYLHPLGESATQPIEPRYGTLAALLLLVGKSPLRRRALPSHRIAAHSEGRGSKSACADLDGTKDG